MSIAALTATSPTLMDIQKRLDPKGGVAPVIELLAQSNEILEDMAWLEANQVASHLTTVRTGIPEATWRKLYQGVQPTKSTTKQVTDTIGMLETRALIDCDLADLNGNSAAWRVSEERAFIEGINQQLAETLFYGDSDQNPERFMGLASRYNGITTDSSLSTFNVVDAGGTGSDNTSIWFVVWGQNTVHGIYPKGSTAGLTMEDKGKITIPESDGSRWDAYETKYSWKCGLSVRDWRAVARVASIDVSDLVANDSSAADLVDLMVLAYHKLNKTRKLGRPAIYCNRTVLTALDRQARGTTQYMLNYGNYQGQEVLMFRGIPIRECEQILDTESDITA